MEIKHYAPAYILIAFCGMLEFGEWQLLEVNEVIS